MVRTLRAIRRPIRRTDEIRKQKKREIEHNPWSTSKKGGACPNRNIRNPSPSSVMVQAGERARGQEQGREARGFHENGRLGNLLDNEDKEYGGKRADTRQEEHVTAQPVGGKGVSRRDQTLGGRIGTIKVIIIPSPAASSSIDPG